MLRRTVATFSTLTSRPRKTFATVAPLALTKCTRRSIITLPWPVKVTMSGRLSPIRTCRGNSAVADTVDLS